MEWVKMFLDFVEGISWQLVIAFALFLFREEVSMSIKRLGERLGKIHVRRGKTEATAIFAGAIEDISPPQEKDLKHLPAPPKRRS